MNSQALIPVRSGRIGQAHVQTVNARDLHEFLEVGRDLSTWIKSRIEQYGFTEGVDYVTTKSSSISGSPVSGNGNHAGLRTAIDYHLSLDMAKEVAMVERNEKGKQARQYFIECERRAIEAAKAAPSAPALPDFTKPAEAARAWADQFERRAIAEAEAERLALTNAQMRPKAEFFDRAVNSGSLLSMGEAARVLNFPGIGRNNLFKVLREANVLMLNGLPYQQHIELGRFEVKERILSFGSSQERITTQTYVTQKGLDYIRKLLEARMVAA